MTSTLKNVTLWSLGLILLSFTGIIVFLVVGGNDFYRWAADRILEDRIDRKVEIDGSFSLDMGLEPTLVITDLWIENAPWTEKKEMVRVGRLEFQVALKPLFSGIVHVPRLVIEGLAVDLERGPDGTGNWQIAKADDEDREAVEQKDLFYPLLEFISLKNVTITYRDWQSDRVTEILLQRLQKDRLAADASFTIQGEGRLNQRAFQIRGRFGSLDEALAAIKPYPLELTLDTSGLVAELKGTAQNLPHAEGFDINFTARASSISQVLQNWDNELSLAARGEASARLTGNLESLSVEDFVLNIAEPSGHELQVKGSLSNLMSGRGLDLRFTGKLSADILRPMYDLPKEIENLADGISRLDLVGQITGDLQTPAFENLQAQLEHRSGGVLSLQGHMSLNLSGAGVPLTGLEATSILSLPSPALLEQAMGTELPALGAIHATAGLSWKDDLIRLSSFEAEAKSFGGFRLSAEGPVGKFSNEMLDLDPQLDLSAFIQESKPLVSLFSPPASEAEPPAKSANNDLVLLVQQGLESLGLHPGPEDGIMGPRTRLAIEAYQAKHGLNVDGRPTQELLRHLQRELEGNSRAAAPEPRPGQPRPSFLEAVPEIGPIRASGRLSGQDDSYRLDDLHVTAGSKNKLWIEVSGTLDALRPGQENPIGNLKLQVAFALPSSPALSQLVPPEVPELKEVTGSFDAGGSLEVLSISKLRIEAVGPNGLTGIATGQIGTLSLLPNFATKDLAIALEVRSGNTESISQLVGLRLPDFGAVRAKATLGDRGHLLALTGIDASIGPEAKSSIDVTGEVGDLLALKQVAVKGNFELPIGSLLGPDMPTESLTLGEIRGQFDLSDADGSLGLEMLKADTTNTDLFSLSVDGVFDDLEQSDGIKFQTSLRVLDPSTLGQQIGFDLEGMGPISFTGYVSGSDEKYTAEGKTQVGQTEFSGTLSGSIKDSRPVLSAKLTSPAFHFADFGLIPEAGTAKVHLKTEMAKQGLFSAESISFAALGDFDLDFDVLLDQLEGVEIIIDKAEGRVTLKDGVLKIEPLKFIFVDGSVTAHFVVDSRAEEPEMHLRLEADDVNLGHLLAQVRIEVPLDGELDLLANLKAAGTTPRALSSSLEGALNLAIERGHVRTNLLDLSAVNLVDWMVSDSARKGYSDLNCFIARLDFRDGVAESRQLVVIDTTNVTALGRGNINLRDETLDIEVHPHARKKQFIELTTPFAIKGPLANLSVEVSEAGTVARMVGEILLTPLLVLGDLLPLVNDHGKDTNNPCLTIRAVDHRG